MDTRTCGSHTSAQQSFLFHIQSQSGSPGGRLQTNCNRPQTLPNTHQACQIWTNCPHASCLQIQSRESRELSTHLEKSWQRFDPPVQNFDPPIQNWRRRVSGPSNSLSSTSWQWKSLQPRWSRELKSKISTTTKLFEQKYLVRGWKWGWGWKMCHFLVAVATGVSNTLQASESCSCSDWQGTKLLPATLDSSGKGLSRPKKGHKIELTSIVKLTPLASANRVQQSQVMWYNFAHLVDNALQWLPTVTHRPSAHTQFEN